MSNPNNPNRSRNLRNHLIAPLALLGTVAVLGPVGMRGISGGDTQPSGLSVDQLKALPSAPVTPTQEQALKGAGEIGRQVDAWVYQGPDSNVTTAANLNAEIEGQDPAGFIHTGETFDVPIIPKPQK